MRISEFNFSNSKLCDIEIKILNKDTDEIDNVKKYQEVKKIIGRLYPPRGGLTEMYVADEDREKMNKINRELKELKKKITLLD